MYAAYYYLALTLPLVIWAWFRGPVNRDCGIALAVWFVLAQLGYERGEVEWVSTYVITGVQFLIAGYLVGRHDHHWLSLWLLFSNAAMVLWNAVYGSNPEADAYTFKAVKNGVYLGELGALAVSCIWTNQTNKR